MSPKIISDVFLVRVWSSIQGTELKLTVYSVYVLRGAFLQCLCVVMLVSTLRRHSDACRFTDTSLLTDALTEMISVLLP